MEHIIGHEVNQKFFSRIFAANQLSHAYIFVGPAQVGKYTFAMSLASMVLHTPYDSVSRHPDLYVVKKQFDEKAGKTKKNIDIEQVRDMRAALSTRSMYGGYKIAIVDEADSMSIGAANALLKTLEEPRGQTVIILVVQDMDLLPPTIRSRSQTILFDRVSDADMKSCVASHGAIGNLDIMVQAALGCPGVLINWLENPTLFADYEKNVTQFLSLTGQPFYEKRKRISEWFADTEDHILARHNIAQSLLLWRLILRNYARALYTGQSMPAISAQTLALWTREKILATDDAARQAIEFLDNNIHPRLLVEQVLLAMP
jgi:hypothetical protein